MSGGSGDGDPSLAERLDRLEERIDRLERAVRALAERAAEEPAEPEPEAEPAERFETVDRTPQTAASPPGTASPDPEAAPTSLEERLGADLLAKAGVAVLVLGLAFFIAWAIEEGLIGLRTRIVLGILGGLGVAAAAHPFRDSPRYGRLARVLAGGGFALTYFSTFASHHFAEYQALFGIGFWPNLVALTLVAAVVGAYGLRLRSPAFLVEALLLGLLTAFLAQEFTTFTLAYATAIGLGVAGASAAVGAGRVVGLALATIYGHAFITHLAGEDPAIVLGALTLDAILVTGFVLAAPLRATPPLGEREDRHTLLYAANAIVFVVVGTLVAESSGVLDAGVFTLLAGVGLLGATLPAGVRSPSLAATSAFTALGSLMLGAALALDPPEVMLAWAAAYVIVAALVPVLTSRPVEKAAHVVGGFLALAVFAAQGELAAGLERVAYLGAATFAYAVGFATLKTGRQAMDRSTGSADSASGAHLAVGTLVLASLLLAELSGWRSTVAVAGAGFPLVLAGFAIDWSELRWAGLGLFGLALGKAFTVDVTGLDPALRVVAFLGLGATLVLAAFAYSRLLGTDESAGPGS